MADAAHGVFALAKADAGGGGRLLGTAFSVSDRTLATCLHVIGGDDRNLHMLVPKINTVNDFQRPAPGSYNTVPLKLKSSDALRDIAILEISENSTRLGYSDVVNSIDALSVGQHLQIWGYPHSVDWARVVLTRQDAIVGAKVLLDNGGLESKYVVINTQSRPGQSGSPVFSSTSGAVVAMLVGSAAPPGAGSGISLGGVDPHTLHQTTNAVSAEYVSRMIADV